MALLVKRGSRRWKVAVNTLRILALCVFIYFSIIAVSSSISVVEHRNYKLEENLNSEMTGEMGIGCKMPKLDPFSRDISMFFKKRPKVKCRGKDWVKCYHSRCTVIDEIRETVQNISCKFRDIIYQNDRNYTIGPPSYLAGSESHELIASDHVKVACTGRDISGDEVGWSGNTLGFRKVTPKKPPPGREDSLNVLIFAFDSTSRNAFIRRMPKSWKVLTEELGAVVMESYNILGDGTVDAMMPILTGKAVWELPNTNKNSSTRTTDIFPLIFYKLKEDGYRTAYFEDSPDTGTFQLRFNGFLHQPTDHYLRAFTLEEAATRGKDVLSLCCGWTSFCVGDTPMFKLMMNLTEQFINLKGKHFSLTFIADITHDDPNYMGSADDDTAAFLRAIRRHAENTLLVVMGDHGARYANIRDTLQGKLEQRLPLMALLLPAALVRARPGALAALRDNALVLTTPHDLHATLLDVLGMRQHWNPYKLRGADLPRGLTMLEPIPRNRSCSEAGIEPHWCACVNWQNVSRDDPLYARPAAALLAFINSLLDEVGSQCVPRTLLSIEWVMRQRPNRELLRTHPSFNENYQTKITTGPGRGVFEATMMYAAGKESFYPSTGQISRITALNRTPLSHQARAPASYGYSPHQNLQCYNPSK